MTKEEILKKLESKRTKCTVYTRVMGYKYVPKIY